MRLSPCVFFMLKSLLKDFSGISLTNNKIFLIPCISHKDFFEKLIWKYIHLPKYIYLPKYIH